MSDSHEGSSALPPRKEGHMHDGHHLIHDSFPKKEHGGHHHVSAVMGKSHTNGPNIGHPMSMSGRLSDKGDKHERVYSGGGQL